MEFYLDQPLLGINPDGSGTLPQKPFLLYAPADVMDGLISKGWHLQPIHTFQRYWITRLRPAFLNKKTRDKELTPMHLVIVN
jgi:hypothetical protein